MSSVAPVKPLVVPVLNFEVKKKIGLTSSTPPKAAEMYMREVESYFILASDAMSLSAARRLTYRDAINTIIF